MPALRLDTVDGIAVVTIDLPGEPEGRHQARSTTMA